MSLFDQLGSNAPNVLPNAQSALAQLKSNPIAMLKQRGLSVPDGMSNPQQIVQHLIQSGQVPQTRLQQLMQMIGRR